MDGHIENFAQFTEPFDMAFHAVHCQLQQGELAWNDPQFKVWPSSACSFPTQFSDAAL